MATRFTNLDALVPFAKRRALRGLYDGRMSLETQELMALCTHWWAFSPVEAATIIYTRDVGHHSSGWWKNPDYERCFHLSISYRAFPQGDSLDHDHARSLRLAVAFFGDDARLTWLEGPYSPEGKAASVWHYRLFADEGWQPFKPRGEVYSRDWTPPGWKSFSEIHGVSAQEIDAPFLTAHGDA